VCAIAVNPAHARSKHQWRPLDPTRVSKTSAAVVVRANAYMVAAASVLMMDSPGRLMLARPNPGRAGPVVAFLHRARAHPHTYFTPTSRRQNLLSTISPTVDAPKSPVSVAGVVIRASEKQCTIAAIRIAAAERLNDQGRWSLKSSTAAGHTPFGPCSGPTYGSE
jgi:hypothetical protein